MKATSERYYVYTYTFRSTGMPIQQETGEEELTIEEVWKRKNELFLRTITREEGNSPKRLRPQRPQCQIRLMDSHGSLYHFQLNVKRPDTQYKENFTEESFIQFPYVTILIATAENDQKILVQYGPSAFPDPASAARVIVSHANFTLRNYGLEMQINPMLDKSNFWEIVDKYPQGIAQVEFTIPSPNLPRLNKTVTAGIRSLEKETKAMEAKMVLTAPKEGALELSQTNSDLVSLVESAEEGVPSPKLRPVNQRKWIKASGTPKIIRYTVEALKGLFQKDGLKDLRNIIDGSDPDDANVD